MPENSMSIVLIMLAGNFFSKILAFFREILFAYQFGASEISDAFVLANSLPNILFVALAIAININFVPLYLKIEDEVKKKSFASNLMNVCLMFTTIVSLTIFFFPSHVLRLFVSTLSGETLYIATLMLSVMSFSVIPIIVTRIFQAYSQANNSFTSTALIGIVTNIVLITSYLIADDTDYIILSFGVVLAHLITMLMTGWSARRSGFTYSMILDFNDPKLILMIRLTVPLIIGRFAEDMSVLVDRNIAANLGTGIISGMAYATMFINAINSTVTASITTSVFPLLSKAVFTRDVDTFLSVFIKYFSMLCYVLVPISGFLLLFSDELVSSILLHGALKASAAKIVWECTACYAVGICPFGIQDYLTRGFYAFGNTSTPTIAIVFSLMCNIGLSVLTSAHFGYIGVAFSTSVSYIISSVLLICLFEKKHKYKIKKMIMRILLYAFSLTIVTCIASYLILSHLAFDSASIKKTVLEFIMYFAIYFIFLLYLHKKSPIGFIDDINEKIRRRLGG